MKLTLNWTNKYNLYMRYKNGENINKLHLELTQYTNYNIATTDFSGILAWSLIGNE